MGGPTSMQRWLSDRVHEIGWSEIIRRAGTDFTSGALQGWLRGAIPGPGNQEALSRVLGVKLALIKELAWESERAKEMDGALATAPRKRPRSRVRRAIRSVGLAVTLLGGSGLVTTPSVAAACPDNGVPELRPTRGILSRKRRVLQGEGVA